MKTMNHLGYTADLTSDGDKGVIAGIVTNCRAALQSQGETLESAGAAAVATVDDNLVCCAADGQLAEMPDLSNWN